MARYQHKNLNDIGKVDIEKHPQTYIHTDKWTHSICQLDEICCAKSPWPSLACGDHNFLRVALTVTKYFIFRHFLFRNILLFFRPNLHDELLLTKVKVTDFVWQSDCYITPKIKLDIPGIILQEFVGLS